MKHLFIANLLLSILLFGCDDNSVSNNTTNNTNNNNELCAEETCNDLGVCEVTDTGEPYCECEDGYIWDGDNKLACVLPPDNCEGVTCNQNGTCELDEDNSPYCECDAGYTWDGENKLACVPENVDWKPVIYLYPPEPLQVNVQFAVPEDVELLYTYPEYSSEGWCVNAYPDGTLYDCQTGLEFYALFWEGITPDNFDLQTGFVVKSSDTVPFLEEKLALLGLNRREANEFIMYWLPVLKANSWNFIHFALQSWTQSVPLLVEPKPDTSIRFLMLYSPLDVPVQINPQKIIPPKRKGFTLVEWGGRRVQY
ncbi:MAG: hypothetical protein PF689_10295 [Deltaproteobacteria bacterium]|jgi:hypothetical protein|nr:hypothetical protein [Deltaproteobacteria bacterium]